MRIQVHQGLAFVAATVGFRGKAQTFDRVLLDTGSAGTIFSADRVAELGVYPEPQDPLRRIRGVGGTEFVYAKRVDHVGLGELVVQGFEIEVGALDYGFLLDGVLGLDFLRQAHAILDLDRLEIRASSG